jgi:hypothetical protein
MTPTGKALVEGYRKDILSSFEKDKQLYNPVRDSKPRQSPPALCA